jgi:MFS transporter, SP family, sugar:H+ symporter
MAGGGIATAAAGERVADYHSKLNAHVILVSLIAASGGLLFGYDIGVTGGVESMASFQKKFFPDVYARTELGEENTNPYCTYNDHVLQLFTSSLFLAGLFISFPASFITRKKGRKVTMVFAGCNFLIGAALNAGAQNLGMLIVGRILLGFGVGSANAVVPLYLSEMAPHNLRGSMNICFQLMVRFILLFVLS